MGLGCEFTLCRWNKAFKERVTLTYVCPYTTQHCGSWDYRHHRAGGHHSHAKQWPLPRAPLHMALHNTDSVSFSRMPTQACPLVSSPSLYVLLYRQQTDRETPPWYLSTDHFLCPSPFSSWHTLIHLFKPTLAVTDPVVSALIPHEIYPPHAPCLALLLCRVLPVSLSPDHVGRASRTKCHSSFSP